jgi:predicted NBD/HSP70 family sugar kinase
MHYQPGRPTLLRSINDGAAFRLLLSRGVLSRGQIGELTGLSKPTTNQMLERMQAAKLVVVAGENTGRPGPNAQLYAVNPAAAYIAGVNVEPGRLTVEIADVTGAAIATLSVKHRKSADPVDLVRATLDDATGQAGLGVSDLNTVVCGVPGVPDDRQDCISYADSIPRWERPGVLAELREAIGVAVIAENDVNLAATAERGRGVAGETEGFALLWLGDGLGLAIDIKGELYRGATGQSGEIGYMPVLGPDGVRGDLQALIGGPAVLELATAHGIQKRDAATAVQEAIRTGNDSFIDVLASRIAIGVAAIASVLDPQLVVLAGNVGTAGGSALCTRVTELLPGAGPLRPVVLPGSPDIRPVLDGAIELGLSSAIENLFTDQANRGQ